MQAQAALKLELIDLISKAIIQPAHVIVVLRGCCHADAEAGRCLAALLPSIILLIGGRGNASHDAAGCVHRLADSAGSCQAAALQLLADPCLAALSEPSTRYADDLLCNLCSRLCSAP